MRRLDRSLTRLAERGHTAGADTLIERVERRLATGGDSLVVAFDPRRTDMQTQQETQPVQARRGAWIAAAAFGALIVIAVAAALVIQLTGEDSLVAGQPPGPLEEFVHALRANDVDAAQAVIDSEDETTFVPWLIGLDTSGVEFTDCALVASDRVSCTVRFGPDWFYNRITGEDPTTTFSALIIDDELAGPSMPGPEGMLEADAEFERWVLDTYPERYDEMFTDFSISGHIRFRGPSGEARTELADEYLASR